jgi:hypothetical protein
MVERRMWDNRSRASRCPSAARAKIRTLLALDAHVADDTKVSDSDVNRVEQGIKAGKSRQQVLPKLNPLRRS